MNDYIQIATLNDFIFCPYSIYLHNVYMETDESLFKAAPQTQGTLVHQTIENKTASHRADDLLSLPVCSEQYQLMGRIDMFRKNTGTLIERKYQLKHIYQGQIYQLWGQMLCLCEMGYKVHSLAFYEISTNKMISIAMPTQEELNRFCNFLEQYRSFDPATTKFLINPNKCCHCIYCNLCDKTDTENVYT